MEPDTPPGGAGSSGYDFGDHGVTGFILTHLSDASCAVYGDFSELYSFLELLGRNPCHNDRPEVARLNPFLES